MNEILENKNVNYQSNINGKAAAICECCGKQSKYVPTNSSSEPSIFYLSDWSISPFPKDFIHNDGSIGSIYHCPSCDKQLSAGKTLKTRSYTPKKY